MTMTDIVSKADFQLYFSTHTVLQKDQKLILHRGYYMAAGGYEFYLRVLKIFLASERSVYFIDTDDIST